jgi:hypothetical protein
MEKETFGSFFSSVKEHSVSWLEAKKNIYTLKAIRLASKIAGNFAWLIVSLFLFLLFSVFIGLTLGFWFSSLTGSYIAGFGIVTALILLKIVLLTVLKKKIFIDPVIRKFIRLSKEEWKDKEEASTN